MKSRTLVCCAGALTAGALLASLTGCAPFYERILHGSEIRQSQPVVNVDANPSQAAKGYVEFTSLSSNWPYPIFLVDNQGKAIRLGEVGLKRGEMYDLRRHGAPVGETLRVALPSGNYQFMAERNGKLLQVPVIEGQVTPVELDYALLDRADNYVLYRLDSRVFAPRASR